MKAIITVGISASGKTTWAKEQSDYQIVCRDDIRRMFLEWDLNRKLKPGELWSLWKWKNEDAVTEFVKDKIALHAHRGENIIIADTNLIEKYRTLTTNRLVELGYEVELKLFPISFEEAVKRDAARVDGVGQSVIMKQWLQYQAEFGPKKFVAVPGAKPALICDLDGTLAHMNKRGPFEWGKVDTDTLDVDVATILDTYAARYEIIIMSGRDSVSRSLTEKWLNEYEIPYSQLFMREAGDTRKDHIVKLELFDKYVRNVYDVRIVIDDRPQVLRLWHSLGLKTISMGNTFIEF